MGKVPPAGDDPDGNRPIGLVAVTAAIQLQPRGAGRNPTLALSAHRLN